ncbi:asparagine synthase-related protein [Actinomyces stomatis]|uniref:asparagine synthase-related protein n=1 Tax=Actinomyces stomatis TaxID=3050227 RepID=UPI002852A929|nr:asparagine synthase-related protein [Actinomyces sp. PK606]
MHDLDHTDRTDTTASGYRLHLTSSTWTHGPASTESPASSSPLSGQCHVWRPLPPGPGDLESLRQEQPGRRTGAWTLIEAGDGVVRLTTDRTRSHHLLFTRAGDTWIISDDPQELRRHAPTWARDEQAAEVFLHAGFTPGTRTLAHEVYATPAGSVVELRSDGTWSSRSWETYRYDADPITSPEEFADVFRTALDTAVERVLQETDGRQLLVPLSGGLDSRLLAVWLKRHGARDVVTFTYGVPGSTEVAISRGVAEALEMDWFTVDLDPTEMARTWAGPDGVDFQKRTWGLTSLPHVQDWYALLQMRRSALIDTDAVFLPGHTIVGNMHDEHLLEGGPSRNDVLTTVARHHSLLQGDRSAWRHLPLLRRAVVQGAQEVSFPIGRGKDLAGSGRSIQELVERVNLQERQAKYINESFKAYEAFGYGWALPMLDTEVWRTWLRGSEDLTATRDWYAQFTAEAYAEATGTASQLFEAPAARIPAGPRRLLMAALTVTGTRTALSRAVSMRTMLHHPMAFEAFNAPMPRTEQIMRMARGATSTGLWTRLFLQGTWGAEPVAPMGTDGTGDLSRD